MEELSHLCLGVASDNCIWFAFYKVASDFPCCICVKSSVFFLLYDGRNNLQKCALVNISPITIFTIFLTDLMHKIR